MGPGFPLSFGCPPVVNQQGKINKNNRIGSPDSSLYGVATTKSVDNPFPLHSQFIQLSVAFFAWDKCRTWAELYAVDVVEG